MLGYYAIIMLHVLVCFILILVVLLQSGKGADLAGAFGGGATQTAFGSRGPASFLSKVTTGAAIMFMITSIALSGLTTGGSSKSIMESGKGGATTSRSVTVPVRTSGAQQKGLTPDEIKRRQAEIESKAQQQPPAKAPVQPTAPAGNQTPAPAKKAPTGKSPF
ncbi:MAG: preprotein translocase subunit SecG [Acidobacteriota bacterium]